VALGGLLLGLVVHAAAPGRDTRGVLLAPGVATAAAAGAWSVLSLLGWRADGTWIWVVSFLASGVAAVLVPVLTVRRRREADRQLFARLVRGSAAARP